MKRFEGAHVLLGLWLVALWVLLWGELSWANLAGGTLAAALVVAFERHLLGHHPPSRPSVVAAARFTAYVAWAVLVSTVEVVRAIVRPRRVATAVVAVPLRTARSGVVTAVANAMTLTPGTMSLAVRGYPPVLYLHVLCHHEVEPIVAEVRRLEDLAAAVIGLQLEEVEVS